MYQLSFRYRISNRLDMVNIQLELTDNNGVMHRYTRFEPDTYKFGENNDYWWAEIHILRLMKTVLLRQDLFLKHQEMRRKRSLS